MRLLLSFFALLISITGFCQSTQTLRGRVLDKESKSPLVGVLVSVVEKDFQLGAVSDSDGNYLIAQLPVGKRKLSYTYIGYQTVLLTDVLVTSAKEVILNVEMEESAVKMTEVTVVHKREHINDMALVSARQFDVQETERYAGSRSDPARMASNFAGAQGGDDSRNDIVIRGNSPQGVLWRLEGIDIPNPNHFAVPGTTGGPVSMLNSKTLGNSDFFMGAFPAEYGNANAGVFDLRLRNGNNDKYEFTGQLGFLGTELAAEGPLSRKKGSSFLITYRYSTLQLFQGFNIKIGTTSVPNYQDASFKLNFPIGKSSNLSFFGIGGLSGIDLIVSTLKEPSAQLYGESDRDQYFNANAGIIGGAYTWNANKKTVIKLTVAETVNDIWAKHVKVFRGANFSLDSMKDILGYDFATYSTVAHLFVNKKVSARRTFKAGVINNYYYANLIDSSRQYPTTRQDWLHRANYKGGTNLTQAYVQYKYRPTDRITLTAGVHTQYLSLNGSVAFEPRIAGRWAVNNNNIFTAGYGLQSQMQSLYQYYALDSSGVSRNKNIGFTRSQHLVVGYERILSNTIRLRTEAYHQYLFEVPVETRIGSSYSALNQGSTFSRDFPGQLQNTGTGFNYGLEMTLEKKFSNGYYALLTGSVFDSKAQGNDGVFHSTDFNSNYAFNILGGYEHKLGKYGALIGGLKATFIGGKLYSPVDTVASNRIGDMVVKDDARNTLRFPSYFRADLKIGVRINAKKFTHEIALDLVNITNTKNLLSLTYSSDLAAQGNPYPFFKQYQLGFLPLFSYRIDFGIKRKV